MHAREVGSRLDQLAAPPAASDHAAVLELGRDLSVYVGWSDADTAVLLLPPQTGPCPEVRLRYLEVLPAAEVTLRIADSEPRQVISAAIVRCRLEGPGVRLAFESIAAALASRLEDEGVLDLSIQIPSLERLFTAFSDGAETTVIGLWAELVLIARARDAAAVVAAWHQDPRATFDFRHLRHGVEVKASRDPAREHWFSLNQWRSGEHSQCEVASFIVAPLETGISVADLLDRLQDRLVGHPALQSKLIEVAGRTLGRDFGRASTDRFDLESALRSLRFVDLRDIPHGRFDPGVLDARWRTSLEHTEWNARSTWSALEP